MANRKQEEGLRIAANMLEEFLEAIYAEKMGFSLIVFPQGENDEAVADYIANCHRGDMIDFLRSTADRLEKNQDIPAGGGEA